MSDKNSQNRSKAKRLKIDKHRSEWCWDKRRHACGRDVSEEGGVKIRTVEVAPG